ncbi:hypothetical protein N7466_002610 [Penicillium verhagenii]|uniref:uncharacterized protein n=1 Tax=Penicillium verhagenii TaxID=1562060 RepID=UPI0025457048|nr:uncharacterized protein N7466_002610 [Penicillium verhagenii]KAJ5939476.1 hypothetical protein N7466_002610 [Penicillium verhagenii]
MDSPHQAQPSTNINLDEIDEIDVDLDLDMDTPVPRPRPTDQSNATIPTPPFNDTIWESLEAARDEIDRFAKQHGFATVIRRSKKTKKGVLKTIKLGYSRGRSYKSKSTGQHNVSTIIETILPEELGGKELMPEK